MHCAVLGSPIEHSLSPTLHRAAYAMLGLDWSYDAIEVTEPGLTQFLDGLDRDWRGLSLTMPLKRTVVALLASADPLVNSTGVANTVVFADGERHGSNTDIPGAANAIRERTSQPIGSAVILGGGATAVSLGWALADLGCERLTILVRNPSNAQQSVEVMEHHSSQPHVTVASLADLGSASADVVASTIPVAAQSSALLAGVARADPAVVFDALYDPWPTPLAQQAVESGRAVVSGLDLLVHQAALQVTLMTGRSAPLETMRAAGARALAARTRS